MTDVLALFEAVKKKKGKLSKADQKFRTDLHFKVTQNPDLSISMKQAGWLNDIRNKIDSTPIQQPLFESSPCGECRGSGWIIPGGIPETEGIPYVIRCDCKGGPEALAGYLNRNGKPDYAKQILNNPLQISVAHVEESWDDVTDTQPF